MPSSPTTPSSASGQTPVGTASPTHRPGKKLNSLKLKTTTKIPTDINALANKKDHPEENNKDTEPKEFYGNAPFTFDDLQKHWKAFAATKKAEGKDAEHMVLQQEISLDNDTTIVIKLTNAVKIDILDRFRSDLITYLKKHLDNGSIKLETELLKEKAKRMIYTNKEKFEYLAEKRPILNQLRERLGLDPDF